MAPNPYEPPHDFSNPGRDLVNNCLILITWFFWIDVAVVVGMLVYILYDFYLHDTLYESVPFVVFTSFIISALTNMYLTTMRGLGYGSKH